MHRLPVTTGAQYICVTKRDQETIRRCDTQTSITTEASKEMQLPKSRCCPLDSVVAQADECARCSAACYGANSRMLTHRPHSSGSRGHAVHLPFLLRRCAGKESAHVRCYPPRILRERAAALDGDLTPCQINADGSDPGDVPDFLSDRGDTVAAGIPETITVEVLMEFSFRMSS